MAEMRGRLQLKKELTQIRKAARVLRDPGTTSSWKSPLSSSRSIAAAASVSGPGFSSARKDNNISNEQLANENNNVNVNGNGKEKRVFLYNWKNQKSSSETSAIVRNDDDDNDDEGYSSIVESFDDSLSDARNGGDSKSDTFLANTNRASSIFRCRDANLVSLATPSMKRAMAAKRKSKRNKTLLDSLSKYRQKQIVLARNSIALGLGRDESVEQSDDTEDYCNSEDFRKYSTASPFLLKLKHKNWSHSTSKLLRGSRKEDSSYTYSTPALSTSSYNRYVNRNPSTIGSWDATTASLNDNDDEMDDHLDLPGRQGCGIPCYWSKRTPKHRGVCGSCYSPSFSDTLRRKGSSILCGSRTMYHGMRGSSSISNKRRMASRRAQCILPLIPNSGDGRVGSSIGTGRSNDELSTNFGELDLEGLSRLDGRRWSSSCRSQDGLEIVALNGEGVEEATLENIRSLSEKYRPMFFDELIGQNIVVQSLVNAISRGRIAPVYLFQGPRGTGKTSTAKIFAAALNCLSIDETKPCGYCRECTDFFSGKSRDFLEFDGTNKQGIDRVRYVLKNLSVGLPSASSRFKVFVIDECHLLASKTWLAFLKFLEEPPQRVVFIFITTDIDNVPRTVQSRCQKFLFNKIKDGEIVARLRKISTNENLDVESDALDLIALNGDGSLRDAETMLDQLSLLGKRITTSLVNELVGVVSDEKLLELLELAMSSNTAETVKRARELTDSGVDPMVLMSQLASLIMDIIVGTNIHGRSLNEAQLDRLKHALKLLSEAEKRLRVSSERSTWFTATLLQLGSVYSPNLTQLGSSRRQSSRTTEEDPSSTLREATVYKRKLGAQYVAQNSTSPSSLHEPVNGHQGEVLSWTDGHSSYSKPPHGQLKEGGPLAALHGTDMVGNMIITCRYSDKLNDIWAKCIERCHSKTLKQLLRAHGKLWSISEVKAVLIAYVAFGNEDIKSRAERFLSSITNSIETVLRRNVEVRIILLSDGEASIHRGISDDLPKGMKKSEMAAAIERERKALCSNANGNHSIADSHQIANNVSRGSFHKLGGKRKGSEDHSKCSPCIAEGNSEISSTKDRRQEIPIPQTESIIREQRLETAWLQAAEKGTPGSLNHLRPEKNQVLPQEGIYQQNHLEFVLSSGLSSQQGEDELNQELKILKLNDERVLQKDHNSKRGEHYPMSPSLLHDSSFMANFSRESLGYESGSATGGCSGLFCWNSTKPHKRGKVKGTLVRSRKGSHLLLFGDCTKAKKSESRLGT